MWSQVTIFCETVGGIWETVLVPQNTLKKTLGVDATVLIYQLLEREEMRGLEEGVEFLFLLYGVLSMCGYGTRLFDQKLSPI